MIRLLNFLLDGCFHEWVENDRVGVEDNSSFIGYAVFCTCKKCGTHKSFNLY